MVMKVVLCLALIALGNASYCSTFTCDSSLASNVCASFTSGQAFKLNSNGCQSGYECAALNLYAWLKGSTLAAGATFSCSVPSSGTTTSGTWTSISCPTKEANKNFKNGQTVISCTSDTDCQLADLTYSDCSCIFKTDGSGVCIPSSSNDQIFSGFWDDCGTSNTLTDYDTYMYWSYYVGTWDLQQSTVSCMNIFMETQKLSDLFDAYDGAAALAVGVFGLLALH